MDIQDSFYYRDIATLKNPKWSIIIADINKFYNKKSDIVALRKQDEIKLYVCMRKNARQFEYFYTNSPVLEHHKIINKIMINHYKLHQKIYSTWDVICVISKPLHAGIQNLIIKKEYFNKMFKNIPEKKYKFVNIKKNHEPLYSTADNLPTLKRLCLQYLHVNLRNTGIVRLKSCQVDYSKHIQAIKKLKIPKSIKFELKKMHYTCKSRYRIKGFSSHSKLAIKRYFLRKNAPILKFIKLKENNLHLNENEIFSFSHVLWIRQALICSNRNLFPTVYPEKSKLCIEILQKSIGVIQRFECSMII